MTIKLWTPIYIFFFFSNCPEGWTDFGSEHGCFLFAEAPEDQRLNWFEAQVYCNNLYENAYLAEIPDLETQKLLANHADKLADNHWWLGATDIFKEGAWRWERTQKPFEFTYWGPGQPTNDNYNPSWEDGHTQDCMFMILGAWFDHQRRWYTRVCDIHMDEQIPEKPLCQMFFE